MRAKWTVILVVMATLYAVAVNGQEASWKEKFNRAEDFFSKGRYAEAASAGEEALKAAEKEFGPDHPAVAQSVNSLAEIYSAQGKYAEAEQNYKRALAIIEKTKGPEHLSLAPGLTDLGFLYGRQGRYSEAESQFKRLLVVLQVNLGAEHPEVGATAMVLGALYEEQKKYAEAEQLFRQALVIWEKTDGPEAAQVAWRLDDLARVYMAQGKYAEAEPLFKRALAIREKVGGPTHFTVGMTLREYADLLRKTGRVEEAQRFEDRATAMETKEVDPALFGTWGGRWENLPSIDDLTVFSKTLSENRGATSPSPDWIVFLVLKPSSKQGRADVVVKWQELKGGEFSILTEEGVAMVHNAIRAGRIRIMFYPERALQATAYGEFPVPATASLRRLPDTDINNLNDAYLESWFKAGK